MALTDNLISYYKFDESSGNAADSVGDNTGTNSNVTYAASVINNGAVFNGTSAAFDMTRFAELEAVGALTIAGWFKQTTLDQLRTFFQKGDVGGSASGNFGAFTYTDGNLYWEPESSANRGRIDYSLYMSADTWTHIAFVFNGAGTGNGGRLKIYFNGTEQTLTYTGTIGTTAGTSTSSLQFGKRPSNTAWWNGGMDEIGVWTRALSSAEITQLYNSGAGLAYPFVTASVKDIISSGFIPFAR